MEEVRKVVKEKTGVELNLEIELLGDWSSVSAEIGDLS
jgi:UDP-N-acetylenolpyruvoylglucosamine reductase